jgi:hypothetical protein
VAFVAFGFLRIQVAAIYFVAAGSKLTSPGWRAGTAMATILNDPLYGLPAGVRHFALALSATWFVKALTYSVLAVEFGIAVCAFCGRRVRRTGFLFACALHGGIILTMGLIGFGIAMICIVLIAYVRPDLPGHRRVPRKVDEPSDGGLAGTTADGLVVIANLEAL